MVERRREGVMRVSVTCVAVLVDEGAAAECLGTIPSLSGYGIILVMI